MEEDFGERADASETSQESEGVQAAWMEESEPASSGLGCFRVMIAALTGTFGLCAGVPLPLLGVWFCVAVITLLRDYTTGLSPDITMLGCLWRLTSIGLWLAVVGSILESV